MEHSEVWGVAVAHRKLDQRRYLVVLQRLNTELKEVCYACEAGKNVESPKEQIALALPLNLLFIVRGELIKLIKLTTNSGPARV